ncbi:hypothetical protein K469DRAFT_728898 [Zopfia rhizophila CBS 207.26]|uniref:Matrin-type domain-containing protein n=1 Tax=Zopfia rhizophila CBS 207.26 TaxID=1314779 RepID=A0A6A6ESY1_9PEZI|nr:hypothetical protein K469DRAFT_728898 [Zopfia rhizophila CBS 207.26]
MAEKTNGTEDKNENNSNNEKTSNMLKPLAWDGSPIPTGLWKLHGGFPCEICDNFVYTGQRSFDMHFSEPRHQYGLKSLGIANSTQFRGLTGIKEACDLWEKIQEDAKEKATVSVVQQEENEVNTVPATAAPTRASSKGSGSLEAPC